MPASRSVVSARLIESGPPWPFSRWCLTQSGPLAADGANSSETRANFAETCPVSANLARRHAADLRWARFAETAPSWLSH
jgi:hypothetical protein